MNINERIRFLRKQHLKMTQKRFAEKLGMKQTSVSTFEQDGASVTEQTKTQICSMFNISRNWLENGIEPMENLTDFNINSYIKDHNASEVEIAVLRTYFDFYFQLDKSVRDILIKKVKQILIQKDEREKAKEIIIDADNVYSDIEKEHQS